MGAVNPFNPSNPLPPSNSFAVISLEFLFRGQHCRLGFNHPGRRRPRTLDMGDDDPRLRWRWLHGLSPVAQGSRARARCGLIEPIHDVKRAAFGRLFFLNGAMVELRSSMSAKFQTHMGTVGMTLTETFDQLDWATIESDVELKQEEHLHLDFKTLKNSELTNGDDKRNIARCISGFANSSGGIMIWGIDARKNSDGIDCATAIVELRKPAVLVSRLNTLSGDATSPIIDGLRHKPILNSKSGGGVVATFVPETDGGPYMAMLGEQRYHKRSGDSFYQMEHFDLEDMFGRRQKPNLEIIIQPSKVEDAVEDHSILVRNTWPRGCASRRVFDDTTKC